MGFARLILAMVRCPKFIVARIHGKAVGGGVGVTAAADYAIAAPGAAVKLSELAVGIGPFVVGPVIERRIGTSSMSHLAIDATGWRDANWAREKGLYAQVVESAEELDDAVGSVAKQLAASNPEAMARMKEVFWVGTEHWEELLPARAAMSGKLVLSEFAQKAIKGR
jgi:methylglutaconyl-CoA hydratase